VLHAPHDSGVGADSSTTILARADDPPQLGAAEPRTLVTRRSPRTIGSPGFARSILPIDDQSPNLVLSFPQETDFTGTAV